MIVVHGPSRFRDRNLHIVNRVAAPLTYQQRGGITCEASLRPRVHRIRVFPDGDGRIGVLLTRLVQL